MGLGKTRKPVILPPKKRYRPPDPETHTCLDVATHCGVKQQCKILYVEQLTALQMLEAIAQACK